MFNLFKSYRYIILIILLALSLRLVKLTVIARPMWYDETFTAWLAQLPPAELVSATAGDVHPPLYYLIEWATVHLLGSAPWALRLPSLIFGVLAVWLAYRLFLLLDLPPPVLYTATLAMAVLPVQLHYSTNARMYTLLLALSIWAAIQLKKNHFGCFALIGLLMMYTHNAAAFTLAGLGLWWLVLVYPDWLKYIKHWLFVLGIVGLGYAPWAFVLFEQSQTNWWLQVMTPGMVLQSLDFLFWFEGIRAFYTVHTGVLVLGLLVAGWIWLAREGRIDLVVPPLGAMAVNIIFSLAVVPVFLHRSFVSVTPWLYVAAAWAMWRIWQRLPRLVLYAGIVPVLLLGTVGYWLQWPDSSQDARLLSRLDLQSGDLCYHYNLASLVFFRYYLPHCDHWLWPEHLTSSPNLDSQAAMGMQKADLSDLPRQWERAWLFVNNDPFADLPAKDTIQREAALAELAQYEEAAKTLSTVHKVTTSHQLRNETWLVQKND